MSSLEPKQRWTLGIGAALLALLLAAVFTFGSLDVPFEPKNWRETIALLSVSSFVTAALLVFGLILMRTVLRLWTSAAKNSLERASKPKWWLEQWSFALARAIHVFCELFPAQSHAWPLVSPAA